MEYHKIDSPWKRVERGEHKGCFIRGAWSRPVFKELAHVPFWIGQEKIDGTNVRLYWDSKNVRFAGRTDNAQLHPSLFAVLIEKFNVDAMSIFNDEADVVLYGEGYGPKIQTGALDYGEDYGVALFDVTVNGKWMEMEDVRGIASTLGVHCPRLLFTGSLAELTIQDNWLAVGQQTLAQPGRMEGLVLRPPVVLLDANGKRIITKIKAKDRWAPVVEEVSA
jgi:hypothetical protein